MMEALVLRNKEGDSVALVHTTQSSPCGQAETNSSERRRYRAREELNKGEYLEISIKVILVWITLYNWLNKCMHNWEKIALKRTRRAKEDKIYLCNNFTGKLTWIPDLKFCSLILFFDFLYIFFLSIPVLINKYINLIFEVFTEFTKCQSHYLTQLVKLSFL